MIDLLTFWPVVAVGIILGIGASVLVFALWLEAFTRSYPFYEGTTRRRRWLQRESTQVLVYLALLTGLTQQQVQVWRSEPSLWAHAVEHAPLKPRPVVNLARALILSGHTADAERLLSRALALAEQPHVLDFDRRDAVMAATANLQTTAIMQAVLGR